MPEHTMNHSKVFALSVALLGLAILSGCQRENELPESNLHEVVFHAGWDPETRTELQEDGSVWWSPGDEISLFVGSGSDGGFKLTSVETEASPKADFRGEIPTIEGEYVAVYPYDESTSYDENTGTIVLQLPERQMARENNFPDKTFKSVAISTDDHLYFKNLFSGIKFTVANEGIKEVEFAVTQDVFLPDCASTMSGWLFLTKDGELTTKESGSSKVTIVAPENQCFIPGKFYYVTIPARSFENGLIVTYKKETTEATLVLEEDVTFKKSTFKRLYAKDADLEFHKRARKHATIPHFGSMLPNGIDQTKITEAHFHVSSDKTTETILDSYPDNTAEPIYFELDGTVANYYTSADVYKVVNPGGLFGGWRSLQRLDLSSFDVSSCLDFSGMFQGCWALKEIEFGDFNTSNAKKMQDMFRDCISLESLDLSGFNTSKVENMYYMFTGCRALKELDLSNFDTHNVTIMGDMFNSCYRLEKLDISNFSSDKMEYAPELFYMCQSLLKLNLGSFDLSRLDNNFNTCYKLASRSRNCAVLCTPATKEALLSTDAKLGNCEPYIQWFVPGDVLPDLSMNLDPDMYYSTDYSQDKKVKMLNVATEGNGIDVVIMGEAYSDRLIGNGTYEADMRSAMEQIFSVEPFKSFRNLFNVYMVNAVSENEIVGEFTAFGYGHDSWFGNGGVDRDDVQIDEYIGLAVGHSEDRIVTTLILVNQDTGDGVSLVDGSASDSDLFDYPKINGIAFGSKSPDDERFKYVICHEFGHAFAALHDEYVTNVGEMETWESDYKKYYQTHLGWWSNVSFTPDPSLVGWHRFLEDGSGYDATEVSIIEGALYSQGIWKSVEESMMNAGGEYSVPAREAIYKKIHKVAYGEDWQYNFEDFVRWDRAIFASPQPAIRYRPNPTIEHVKPMFKIEESVSHDGQKKVTVIMN